MNFPLADSLRLSCNEITARARRDYGSSMVSRNLIPELQQAYQSTGWSSRSRSETIKKALSVHLALRGPTKLFINHKYICLVFLIFWTQLTNSLTGTPHLLVAHSLEFLLQTSTIVGLRVCVDGDLSLVTSLH